MGLFWKEIIQRMFFVVSLTQEELSLNCSGGDEASCSHEATTASVSVAELISESLISFKAFL